MDLPDRKPEVPPEVKPAAVSANAAAVAAAPSPMRVSTLNLRQSSNQSTDPIYGHLPLAFGPAAAVATVPTSAERSI